MTKYELLNLVRDLTETIKTNSNTMEALTFQVRDMQNDADVLKTQKMHTSIELIGSVKIYSITENCKSKCCSTYEPGRF